MRGSSGKKPAAVHIACDLTPISRDPHKSFHAYISDITGTEEKEFEHEDCILELPCSQGDQSDIRMHDCPSYPCGAGDVLLLILWAVYT